MISRQSWSRWTPSLVLVALALAASITALGNDYAYDSIPIIRENTNVHTLAAPWRLFAQQYWPPPFEGLYRPLAVLWLRIPWALGGGAPWVFHALSIALYAAATLVVYRLTRRVLAEPAAWVAAALFAAHPVHVEVTALAVNQSETMVTLLLTGALSVYLKERRHLRLRVGSQAVIVGCYALGCLIKENAFVLPGLLGLAELTLVEDRRPWRDRLQAVRPLYLVLILVASTAILTRGLVIEGLVGTYTAEALAGQSMGGRALTMLGVVPLWTRLLLFPYAQQVDYLPQEIPTATEWGPAQLQGALLLLLVTILVIRTWRRAPVVPFAIGVIAIALFPVSNVLVPTGVVLSERLLMLPSVGAVVLLGVGAAWLWRRAQTLGARRALVTLLGVVLVAGVARSASRVRIYQDQLTLFTQALKDSPLSYKAHYAYADIMFQMGNNELAERHFRVALRLYDRYPRVYQGLADRYRLAGLCDPAIPLYQEGLAQGRTTQYFDLRASLVACLLHEGRYREAAGQARIGIAGEADVALFRTFLQTADSALAARASPRGSPPATPAADFTGSAP